MLLWKRLWNRAWLNDKKIDLLKTVLTKTQTKKLKNSPCECKLKLTNKQMQNAGFLGLLASLVFH